MSYKVAGIDVHKKVLMVVIMDAAEPDLEPVRRRFGSIGSELRQLADWLRGQGVQEVVMESTAQYWRPVWLELEPQFELLHLAQAFSNRAPRGKKHDFKDAERLARRQIAKELTLSFVPGGEQRMWRDLTRMKTHLTGDRIRLHNRIEALLEEMRIKLSSLISDLFGVSGVRILRALANGQTDPQQLAALGDERLRCTEAQLVDALTGSPQALHQAMLGMQLDRLQQIDDQIAKINQLVATAMKPYADNVARLAAVNGFGVDSAQQFISEVGPQAATFPSADELTHWVGTCPGQDESAEQNQSSRSPKGNKYLRRLLNQLAHAAVKTKGSHLQAVFRRLLPKLGYKGAIWAIAHRLCRLAWIILHKGVQFVERGEHPNPKARKQRAQSLARALRKLGYEVQLRPMRPAAAEA